MTSVGREAVAIAVESDVADGEQYELASYSSYSRPKTGSQYARVRPCAPVYTLVRPSTGTCTYEGPLEKDIDELERNTGYFII